MPEAFDLGHALDQQPTACQTQAVEAVAAASEVVVAAAGSTVEVASEDAEELADPSLLLSYSQPRLGSVGA